MGSDGWYLVSGRTTVGRARPQHYGLGVEQDSSDSDSNADAEAPGGAIAVMFLVWAVLLLLAPAYFGSAGAARTVWYVFAGISGTIGVGGAAVELSGVSRREALKGFGAVIALAVTAVLMGTPPLIWSVPSPWDEILKSSAFVFALATAMGASIEIGKRFALARTKPRRTREKRLGETLLSAVVAVLSLATAVIGFIAAFASKH